MNDDRPLHTTNLDDVTKSIVCTAVAGHPPVMVKTKPMSNLVTKAKVAQSTALPHRAQGVARGDGVEIVETTDRTP